MRPLPPRPAGQIKFNLLLKSLLGILCCKKPPQDSKPPPDPVGATARRSTSPGPLVESPRGPAIAGLPPIISTGPAPAALRRGRRPQRRGPLAGALRALRTAESGSSRRRGDSGVDAAATFYAPLPGPADPKAASIQARGGAGEREKGERGER